MNNNEKKIEQLKALAEKQTNPKIKKEIEDKLKYVNKPLSK